MATRCSNLTHARLLQVLIYNPETGVFTWRIRPSQAIRTGDIAGHVHYKGYLDIGIDGVKHLAHRLAWFYVYGQWPVHEIDHRNEIKHDNRIANLRVVSRAANLYNQSKPRCDNKLGVRGVSYDRASNKFRAVIYINKQVVRLGRFSTIEAAHAAYLNAKQLIEKESSCGDF